MKARKVGKTIRLSVIVALALMIGAAVQSDAQEASGFDGFIQSGTCEAPTDKLKVELESSEDYDIIPYLAKIDGDEGTVTLAYYGAPTAPGFGFATMYTDEVFSLVLVDPSTDNPVACGNLLEPDDENFGQVGMALVKLQPVDGSGVSGFAIVERSLQRESDTVTTRVRIIASTDGAVGSEGEASPDASPGATPTSAP